MKKLVISYYLQVISNIHLRTIFHYRQFKSFVTIHYNKLEVHTHLSSIINWDSQVKVHAQKMVAISFITIYIKIVVKIGYMMMHIRSNTHLTTIIQTSMNKSLITLKFCNKHPSLPSPETTILLLHIDSCLCFCTVYFLCYLLTAVFSPQPIHQHKIWDRRVNPLLIITAWETTIAWVCRQQCGIRAKQPWK